MTTSLTKVYLYGLLACFVICCCVTAQASVLGPVIHIMEPGAGSNSGLWFYTDPLDSKHLLACGALSDPTGKSVISAVVYSSADGGATWRRTLLDNSTKFMSEQNCTFDRGGRAYFVTGASNWYNNRAHHETGHLHVFASDDDGMTWRKTYVRADGWMDWTYLANIPKQHAAHDALIVFANHGTDRLGHWSLLRPHVIESDDGGETFSSLRSWSAGGDATHSAFTAGGTVLHDGTAVFATALHYWGVHPSGSITLFSYVAGDADILLRSTIRQVPNDADTSFPSLAQDSRGRLYVAWTETSHMETTGSSSVWVASSTDGGRHWDSRPILTNRFIFSPTKCRGKSVFDDVSLAVNPKGILGVLWRENRGSLEFAASTDGGRSFSNTIALANYAHSYEVSLSEVQSRDDNSLADYLSVWRDTYKPEIPLLSSFGLAAILQPRTLDASALAASADGVFHAAWSQPRGIEGAEWVTQTIEVPSAGTERSPNIRDIDQPYSCQFGTQGEMQPAIAHLPTKVYFTGLRDVTSSFNLDVSHYSYDARHHEIHVDIELLNKSKNSISYPVKMVAFDLHSDFGTAITVNAGGMLKGHPFWSINGGRPTPLVFRIANYKALPSLYYEGDGVAMAMRVLSRYNR